MHFDAEQESFEHKNGLRTHNFVVIEQSICANRELTQYLVATGYLHYLIIHQINKNYSVVEATVDIHNCGRHKYTFIVVCYSAL